MAVVEIEDLAPSVEIASNSMQIGIDATLAYERGKEDINFFAALAIPDVMTSPLPYFYVVCFRLIVSRPQNQLGKILRFALGLPRGHAKTTFIKVILAWLIAYDKARFIVIVGAIAKNAQNILEDLNTIMGSPNMQAVYGVWSDGKVVDNVETKKYFYHNRYVIIAALGAETSVRGLNMNFERPDVILCDDMQSRENDESVAASKSLRKWFVATLMKSIDTKGDRLIVYIGNMYSEDCILHRLQKSPNWISMITGAILEDGTPLWPALHSLESLMESYYHDASIGEAEVWFAEVMNDPRNPRTSLIKDSIPDSPYPEDFVADAAFITIDPAGYRVHSDDNVIVGHEVFDGRGFVARIDAGTFTPKETVERAITMALEMGASVIGVETTAYQQALKFWLEYFIAELGLTGLEIVELGHHGRSKEARIRAFVQDLMEDNYYFKTSAVKAVWYFQALKYKLGQKNNKDDILDAVAYGQDMRTEYWELIQKIEHTRRHQTKAVVSNVPLIPYIT